MVDIAELGYRVDSSGLVEGTKALDENAAAADKAGVAAERLEKSQKDTGKAASFWANEQAKINARVQEMERIEQRAGLATRQAATATEARELNLQKLLGQINPTVAALNKLAEQEDRLARARDLGMLKPQVWQQYQAMLDATRAKTLEVSRSSGVLGGSLGRLNLHTIETQQSVANLIRSLASGDVMSAQSSITSLTARTGALGGAFTATGLVAGGTAAAIAAVGVAAAKGYMEMRDLDRLLIGIGGSAGALTGSLANARSEIGRLTGEYEGAGKAISQAISSGTLFSEQAVAVASTATNIASLTGQSISSVTSSIMDLAGGSTEALAKLNSQYGFLTVASFNHIEAVREEKGETAALQATLVELERVSGDRVRSMQASAGTLERAWRGVKGEILETIQAFKNIGRTDIEQRLQEAIWNLHNVRATTFGDPLQSERYMKARAEVSRLLGERMDMQDKEWADERNRRLAREVIETQAAAKAETAAASDSINAQLAGLDRVSSKLVARNKIIELYNKLSANDPRQFDGSMQRLIASSDAEIDKRFNRSEGAGKKNADDTSTQTFIANIQRQISANQQLAESGSKVTASDRMVIQARQMLADKTSTMTAASRALLQALIPQLQATDAQAEAEVERQRGMQASIALTERLAQLESQRKKQSAIDLMGLGLGTDETQMMQRKLDIERQYLDEQEKLDKAYNRDRNTLSAEAMAVRQAQYAQDTAALKASLADSLNVERDYQQYRMAALNNWRLGASHAWKDYAFAASDAYSQAGSVMTTALGGWEDAWVRFAQTGKLSFRDMANAIIADLARIAAKQAAVGIINAVASAWGGGVTAAGNSAVSSGTQSINAGMLASYGGGRANGGPVRGSTLYEVGEGGRPELFNDGRGRTYLIPGNDGQVIPAAAAGGAGAAAGSGPAQINVSVVVNSDGSTEADGDTALMQQFGQELGRFVEAKYRELQVRDMRDGGVLRSMTYR
ncbi:TPA: phage tail tape measure protein [Stenotrophomonas maltophilia]